MRYLLTFVLLISWSLNGIGASVDLFQGMVDHQRKMLVLLEGTDDLDPQSDPVFAARNHYAQKWELGQNLIEQAREQAKKQLHNRPLPVSDALVNYLQENPNLHDGDYLAFIDLLDELITIEENRGATSQALQSLKISNRTALSVLDDYRDEYRKTMSRLGTRGTAAREAWQDYIKYLRSLYDYEELLRQVQTDNNVLHQELTRGSKHAADKKDQLKPSRPKTIWGNALPEKTVVLTFDDGPHANRTGEILDLLKKYGVKGYFFSVGKNLGNLDKKGEVHLGDNKSVSSRVVKEGHILANHSYSHPVLTKLDSKGRKQELESTNALLKAVAKTRTALFRPPYGSKDMDLEKLVMQEGLISVMWNVDSLDWADPIPESIADRVLRQVEENKGGILLFHDIHTQTIKALPDILAGLGKRGYRVVTLDGTPFDSNRSGIPKLADVAGDEPLYANSWAVVIGINDYKNWPRLKYAVNDARSVAELLRNKLGFPRDNVIELYDGEATRERITEVLGYQLADQKKIKQDDRVFVFYAGHGATRTLPSGKQLGYIIPVDARLEKFQNRAISMSMLDDFSSLIPAKHLYFVMDSCYSGLALTRSGLSVGQSINYLKQITNRRARQILTAGGADQEVADGGPGGHSVFTWTLLQGMEGVADTDSNGYVTASELGTYVAPVVASYAEQTPAFGNLVGSRGGDFVFKIDSRQMAAIQEKLAAEARHIEEELETMRNDTKSAVKRRLELQVKLEKARNGEMVETAGGSEKGDKDRIAEARRYNAMALQYFKEKKYREAKKEWAEAVRLNPYNPTIVNNYAFVLDRLEENKEAMKWYYRTIELDAKRIPVYLNLGDIMVKLNRPKEAVPYYERYLHLYPSYKKAKELRKNMELLSKGIIPG